MSIEQGMCLAVHPNYALDELFMIVCDNYIVGANPDDSKRPAIAGSVVLIDRSARHLPDAARRRSIRSIPDCPTSGTTR